MPLETQLRLVRSFMFREQKAEEREGGGGRGGLGRAGCSRPVRAAGLSLPALGTGDALAVMCPSPGPEVNEALMDVWSLKNRAMTAALPRAVLEGPVDFHRWSSHVQPSVCYDCLPSFQNPPSAGITQRQLAIFWWISLSRILKPCTHFLVLERVKQEDFISS